MGQKWTEFHPNVGPRNQRSQSELERVRESQREPERTRERGPEKFSAILCKGRYQRKKRYYVGKIPKWADPPSPSMGIFSTKYRFFSEDVPKRKFFKIVKYVL